MKAAVSIPDDVFEKAERLARRMKKSRSQLFSNALTEYVARHAPDHVTEAMDQVCAEIGSKPDPFVSAASRRILERSACDFSGRYLVGRSPEPDRVRARVPQTSSSRAGRRAKPEPNRDGRLRSTDE